ncbi:LuxR C-terminal-related transcriptional regulator [Sphingomonas sp. MMSM20]|uniref:helix-turn-helix transcriptional regulator n=1 Tax=Sphingomonas lycopersici TaxID=2951807 RepID=UPI0022387D1A|nr:LuxR C-terminal-related transcriptional regulator [Sphingomonas lycopersici]MCW6530220.1 LuxR C-terminal-related transcriptional regulator [Sphingomonas lycopersici]
MRLIARFLDDRSTPNTVATPHLMIFIADSEAQFGIPEDLFRSLFGLTRAEAAVAALLAKGMSVDEAAGRLGVYVSTVRSHLRSIFSKTGAARQSELVHLIHSAVPGNCLIPLTPRAPGVRARNR